MKPPFNLTIEPLTTTNGAVRILVESHTIESQKTLSNQFGESAFKQREFTLTTALCSTLALAKSPIENANLLVEIYCGPDMKFPERDLEFSEEINIFIGGQIFKAFKTLGNRNFLEDWSWTIHLESVEIPISDEFIKGKVRITGRQLPVIVEYRWKDLKEYWKGRRKVIFKMLS